MLQRLQAENPALDFRFSAEIMLEESAEGVED
jgi:hypothetical protein